MHLNKTRTYKFYLFDIIYETDNININNIMNIKKNKISYNFRFNQR